MRNYARKRLMNRVVAFVVVTSSFVHAPDVTCLVRGLGASRFRILDLEFGIRLSGFRV